MATLGGIYAITNVANGKRYVGQSAYLRDRRLSHWSSLRRGVHCNRILQNAWNRYGEESFEFTVLEQADAEALCEREQHWIDTLRPEYNIAPVAGTTRGLKHPPRSAEFCERMRQQNLGRRHTPEAIANMKGHGRPHTAEAKAKLAKCNLGRVQTPEAIEKRRAKVIGRKQSEAEIEKRRASLIGKKRTPEQIARIVDAKKAGFAARRALGIVQVSPRKGVKCSDETKRRMSESKRGKSTGPCSPEKAKKIGDAQRGRPCPEHRRLMISATLTGRSTGRGQLSPDQVREVRALRAQAGLGSKGISNRMGITESAAAAVIGNHAYRWVD